MFDSLSDKLQGALGDLRKRGKLDEESISRALREIRLALLEAGDGKIGGLTGRIALLCYGFDAAHGIYTRRIAALLQIAGGLTVALLASAVGFMLWRTAKRGAAA